eukprot:gene8873-9822_t
MKTTFILVLVAGIFLCYFGGIQAEDDKKDVAKTAAG